MECFNCKANDTEIYNYEIPWHYRPKYKYRIRNGETDKMTTLEVNLCENCGYYATYSSDSLLGWDWWDAIDGLDMIIEFGKRMKEHDIEQYYEYELPAEMTAAVLDVLRYSS